MALPVLDYAKLAVDRDGFLDDLLNALENVGFLVLVNYPGLEDAEQRSYFKEVRAFFDADDPVKRKAAIVNSPYYRGWSKKTRGDSGHGQVIEAFQYGFEREPVCPYDDRSVPVYRRLFRGPNTWPDAADLPGFRPAIERLTRCYHKLTHDLGHLIVEALGHDPREFDRYFSWEDPDLAASLNHNYSMAEIDPAKREHVRRQYAKHKSQLVGSHIDGPPFVALLVNDRPGLQVIADDNTWIDAPVTCATGPKETVADYKVPVIPGGVIVNSGGTLMHLSRGRIGATLHRVNTQLIPLGEDRVSLPFFLLPKMEGPLIPFGEVGPQVRGDGISGKAPGGAPGGTDFATHGVGTAATAVGSHSEGAGTGYALDRDRGTNAAVNRMGTFMQVTKKWWREEYRELHEKHQEEVRAETDAAYGLAAARRDKKLAERSGERQASKL